MRFLSLDLLAYGPFTGKRIDLSAGERGLHIVYGDNEAGKSTALRAVRAFLHGFPHQAGDGQKHDGKRLRVGAEIEHSDGRRLRAVRRKGRDRTLLDPAAGDAPCPDGVLRPFLGELEPARAQQMYTIDHAELRAGGETLRTGKGALGEALFSAAMGGVALRRERARLEEELERLFSKRGKNPELNRCIAEYQEIEERVRQAALRPETWEALQGERARLEAERQRLRADREARTGELDRLRRLQQVLPLLARRSLALERIAALGPLPALVPEARRLREKHEQGLDAAAERQRAAGVRLDLLAEARAAGAPDGAILAAAEEIDALRERLGSHRKAEEDAPALEARRAALEEAAARLLAELSPGGDPARAEGLRLGSVELGRLRALGREFAEKDAERRAAEQQLGESERRLGEIDAALAALPAPRDARALLAAVGEAERQGDLDLRLEQSAGERGREESSAAAGIRALPGWSLTLAELESTPLPLRESVDRALLEQEEATLRERSLAARRLDVEAARDRAGQSLRALEAAGEVPDESRLAAARAHRERGWELVRRAWLEGRADPLEERDFAPGRPLAEAYPDSVAEADRIADRLRREADRVARRAELLALRQDAERDLVALAAEERTLAEERAGQLAAWRELWRPAGVEPLSPREMRAWLDQAQALRERAARLRLAGEGQAALAARIARERESLAAAAAGLGESFAPCGSLGQTLEQARELRDRLAGTEQSRRRLIEERAETRSRQASARAALQAAAQALGEWAREWDELLAPLARQERPRPSDLDALLQAHDQLFQDREQARVLRQRLESMARDAAAFAAEVRDLLARAAPDLAGQAPAAVVRELGSRLNRARREHAAEAERARLEAELQRERETAIALIHEHESALRRLCESAGVAAASELPALEVRVEQAAELGREVQALEREILGLGRCPTLAALEAEARSCEPAALPGRIETLEGELAALEAALEKCSREMGGVEKELEPHRGGGRAAELKQEAEAKLAALRARAEQVAGLKLMAALLQEEIESYGRQPPGEALAAAGRFFARLTAGSFAGLGVGFSARDEPLIEPLRAGGVAEDIEHLSEGTRDQLYLALRLAAIERALGAGEPQPLVLDDVLVSFDDPRSSAAIELLGELSDRTQVLLFTHHERIAELGAKADPRRVFVHRL